MARTTTKPTRSEDTADGGRPGLDKTTPLTIPSKFVGTDWAERIRIAKEARALGRELRKGKPKTFNRFPSPKIKYPPRPKIR